MPPLEQIFRDLFIPSEAPPPGVLEENARTNDYGSKEPQDVKHACGEGSNDSLCDLGFFRRYVGNGDMQGVCSGVPVDTQSLWSRFINVLWLGLEEVFEDELSQVKIIGPPLPQVHASGR